MRSLAEQMSSKSYREVSSKIETISEDMGYLGPSKVFLSSVAPGGEPETLQCRERDELMIVNYNHNDCGAG